jgi:hypothetical protein
VVTADAVNAQRDTADYIAGPEEEGGRGSAYLNWTRATAGSSAARSGSPALRRSTSRTSGRSRGSDATRGIESVHWLRDTVYAEDADTGYAGNGPQAMAALAISLLYLSGVTEITRTLQAIARDRNRVLGYLPL